MRWTQLKPPQGEVKRRALNLEHAPYRALNMYVATRAAKDIAQRC
jgi:hypothetical protein